LDAAFTTKPRRREERAEKRFQKLRVLRVFAVDFLGLRLGCTVYIGVHPWFHLLFMMEIEYERE